MRTTDRRRTLTALTAAAAAIAPLAALSLSTVPAAAQADAAQAERTPRETLEDFIHFVRVARVEVAGALARELAAVEMDDAAFADLVEDVGAEAFDAAVAEALRFPDVEPVASAVAARYESGRLMRARSAAEITRNIELLAAGGLFARTRATERLLAAGEYAMPQLIEALLAGDDPILESRVEQVIVQMGRQALVPLMTTLEAMDGPSQQLLVSILRRIGYRTPLPVLVELYNATDLPGVREAAARAIRELGGTPDADPAMLYRLLAEGYYAERGELTSFPDEPFQLLWYVAGGGVPTFREIRTEVYHEAMARRFAERSLQLEPRSPESIALWIAANFSREIDLPDGYTDPSYAEDRRDASFYAVAAGSDINASVLRRGLDDRDTPLARRAIAAIERTAGPSGLIAEGEAGRRPLVEALSYPNRRVRYEAALAFAASQPARSFSGAEVVVPTLAGMVRDTGARYAVVLTGPDREEYDRLRRRLDAIGFTVLPPAEGGLGDIERAIFETPGIDLIVTSGTLGRVEVFTEAVRSRPRLAASPVLALVPGDDVAQARLQYGTDPTIAVRRDTIDSGAMEATVAALLDETSGGALDQAAARDYADRALAALRDLAVARGGALRVEDATVQLVAALNETRGERRLRVADVLARVAEPTAQVALMDAALDASGTEQVALLDQVAESAKRFGGRLETRQLNRLIELVNTASDDAVATSAAALAGVIDLPGTSLTPLILGDSAGLVRSR